MLKKLAAAVINKFTKTSGVTARTTQKTVQSSQATPLRMMLPEVA